MLDSMCLFCFIDTLIYGRIAMLYKCDTCGRTESSNGGPPKCFCGLPEHITLMKPVRSGTSADGKGEGLNEYLTEG